MNGTTNVLVNDTNSGPGAYNPTGILFAHADGANPGTFKLQNGPIDKGFFDYDIFKLQSQLDPQLADANDWVLASYPNARASGAAQADHRRSDHLVRVRGRVARSHRRSATAGWTCVPAVARLCSSPESSARVTMIRPWDQHRACSRATACGLVVSAANLIATIPSRRRCST